MSNDFTALFLFGHALFRMFQCRDGIEKLLGLRQTSAKLVLLTTTDKQTGGVICDTYQTAKTHRGISVNQQSRLSRP